MKKLLLAAFTMVSVLSVGNVFAMAEKGTTSTISVQLDYTFSSLKGHFAALDKALEAKDATELRKQYNFIDLILNVKKDNNVFLEYALYKFNENVSGFSIENTDFEGKKKRLAENMADFKELIEELESQEKALKALAIQKYDASADIFMIPATAGVFVEELDSDDLVSKKDAKKVASGMDAALGNNVQPASSHWLRNTVVTAGFVIGGILLGLEKSQ